LKDHQLAEDRMTMLLVGLAAFGILVGAMIGMSKTPVVGSALPSIFAFMGGSVITLTYVQPAGTARTEAQQSLLGAELLVFSVSVALGLYIGIKLRDQGLPLHDPAG